jgi:hypothetical protein
MQKSLKKDHMIAPNVKKRNYLLKMDDRQCLVKSMLKSFAGCQ